MTKKFFDKCEKLNWQNLDWKNYFFAEVSALAYHDGTRAMRELNKIGFKNYKFLENDGAQCHIFSDEENISLMSKFSTICLTFLKLVTVKSKDMINLL